MPRTIPIALTTGTSPQQEGPVPTRGTCPQQEASSPGTSFAAGFLSVRHDTDSKMERRFENPVVAAVFDGYPPAIRIHMLALRELIFATAALTPGVGRLEEALKWGEPAYLTPESKSGSTIRIAWKSSRPREFGMYFHCQTNLIGTFKKLFPYEFKFEGNRALIFQETDLLPTDALSVCIAKALTYHQRKHSQSIV